MHPPHHTHQNPSWGAAGEQFLRKAAPAYTDGVGAVAAARSLAAGRPNARAISNALSSGEGEESARDLTSFAYVWGQVCAGNV